MIRPLATSAVALLLALTGCAGGSAPTTGSAASKPLVTPPAGSPTARSSKPAKSTSAGNPEPATSAGSPVGKFGQTVTYPDGLEVAVTNVHLFRPSSYLLEGDPSYPKNPAGVKFTVQVRNKSRKVFDANLLNATMVAGKDGKEAAVLCDSANGITCGVSQKVRPGRNVTTNYGFVTTQNRLDQISIEVNSDFERDPATFEGSLR